MDEGSSESKSTKKTHCKILLLVRSWGMILWLLMLALVVVLVILPLRFMPDKEHKFHPGATSLQAMVTVLVVMAGGYWYFIERKGTAHANVTLSATGVKLTDETVLVQARVEIQNTGNILLVPVQWDVRLLSVVPPRGVPVEAIAREAIQHFDGWPSSVAERPAYFDNELQWSTVRRFAGEGGSQIEPGERDIRIFDLLVPCEIRTAKLTIAVRRPHSGWLERAERPGGWWWKDRMLFNLRSLCEAELGSVQRFEPTAGGPSGENERGEE